MIAQNKIEFNPIICINNKWSDKSEMIDILVGEKYVSVKYTKADDLCYIYKSMTLDDVMDLRPIPLLVILEKEFDTYFVSIEDYRNLKINEILKWE